MIPFSFYWVGNIWMNMIEYIFLQNLCNDHNFGLLFYILVITPFDFVQQFRLYFELSFPL